MSDIINLMREAYEGKGRMASIDYVRDFFDRYGHEVKETPDISNGRVAAFRIGLLEEELGELWQALIAGDKVATLDGLIDLQYVLDGCFLTFGMAHLKDAAFLEVHNSNMSKLGADGKPIIRKDGKVMKGPNYVPPNLQQFFEEGEE